MMQELSLNVLDVAENSVRANATLIHILVEEDTAADRLTIVIRDNGKGMTQEQVQTVIDPFYTTRTTRKVGLGVPFFRMAAQLSGGDLTIQSAVGEGTTVTATFGLTSIDRMPLGDITLGRNSRIHRTCSNVPQSYRHIVPRMDLDKIGHIRFSFPSRINFTDRRHMRQPPLPYGSSSNFPR